MHQKTFVLCSAAAVLAVAIACSKSSTPVSPTAAEQSSSDAAADGSTLKATAPVPVSPVNGAQPDSLMLTTNKAEGKFDKTMPLSYQFQISTSDGTVVSACT